MEILNDLHCNLNNVPQNKKEELKNYILNLTKNYIYKNQKLSSLDIIIKRSINELEKFLSQNKNLFFSKIDKGNASVLLSNEFYIKNMEMILSDKKTYANVTEKGDPITNSIRCCFRILENWKKKGYLDKDTQITISRVKESTNARAYGLIKAHKIDDEMLFKIKNNIQIESIVPFRIIISSIDCPKYLQSKMYERILSNSIKKSEKVIKNSFEFLKKIKNVIVPQGYVMISLDVISMYPSIPLKLVNESVKNRWSEIEKYTKIPQTEFLSGLEFMVNMTYFSFNNKFYKQIDGLPMGDPCSPILGDLVFYDLEKRVLDSFDFEILFYGRYVDDTFLIVPRNKVNLIF